jgi:peptide/nickel transport system substrate-binding protein
LTRSGVSNPTIELSYPSDIQVAGISLGDLATRVQANLKDVGIAVKLAPAPVQTALDSYRAAKSQMGLWFWYPDYPDPSDYLVFLPDGNLGDRASWKAGGDPALTSLGEKAAAEMDNDARAKTYQEIQQSLNTKSPFVPLVQPSQVFAYASTLKGVAYHSSWLIDLADLS